MKGKLISFEYDKFIALNAKGIGATVIIEKKFLFFRYRIKRYVDTSFVKNLSDYVGKLVEF
jgi:hypothetical protein